MVNLSVVFAVLSRKTASAENNGRMNGPGYNARQRVEPDASDKQRDANVERTMPAEDGEKISGALK